ncbi:MAG: hypothetical protein ACWGNV_14055, partial [Bacteroidales bacterium]
NSESSRAKDFIFTSALLFQFPDGTMTVEKCDLFVLFIGTFLKDGSNKFTNHLSHGRIDLIPICMGILFKSGVFIFRLKIPARGSEKQELRVHSNSIFM